MGCQASKLDREDEMPAGLRPFKSRIEEIKRRRRVRHNSIVSTTELLKPEDRDLDGIEVTLPVEDSRLVVKEEEGPGSPSFRFYCSTPPPPPPVGEEDSVSVEVEVIVPNHNDTVVDNADKHHARGRGDSQDSSNEDLETKQSKKDNKGRRFKALTKAPSRVYNFLNVRSCSTSLPSTDSPRPVTGRAT